MMVECIHCGRERWPLSGYLGLCRECILHAFQAVEPHIQKVHQASREVFGLPGSPPQAEGGLSCNACFNECRIGTGEAGYCGVKENRDGQRLRPLPREGYFSWYYDSLPTNCVGTWVCPGGTGAGYPRYAYSRGPEYGFKNLAVFYHGCTFNCLFCQNWHYREDLRGKKPQPSSELSGAVDASTSCVCYFGGDPAPQILHSIHASRLAMAEKRHRILRFCWETNGTMTGSFLEEILDIALQSGGCVKFDLKTFHPELNVALCGRSNEQTKANFKLASSWAAKRKEPPLVIASTLLVPGYVEEEEVREIARFIASLDPQTPYSLLAFYPHFHFRDLPTTSRRHAEECRQAALEAGLTRVRLGNVHLLGKDY